MKSGSNKSNRENHWDILFLIAGFLLGGAWLVHRSVLASSTHLFPFYDEVRYLNNARTVHTQGAIGSVASYLNGSNREDNQHPLYLFLLSGLMQQEPHDFTRAKLLSLAQCGATLAIFMLIMWRRFGTDAAVVASLLFGFASGTIFLSHTVLADILFSLLFFLTCTQLAIIDDRPWPWFLTGLLSGLAYLAKGNGVLLLPFAIATGAITMRKKFLTKGLFFFLLMGFLAPAGCLLWRNWLVVGSPGTELEFAL